MAIVIIIAFGTASNSRCETRDFQGMLRLRLGDNVIEGKPLAWSSAEVTLLARDGQLHEFAPKNARNFRRLPDDFTSFSAAEIRGQLFGELGRGFDVTGTGHYLVAHPEGDSDQWAQRFEDLYRSFVHYFSVRGIKLEEPRFPMVAIVWPTQTEFMRYAAKDGSRVGPNILGYYSPSTNRVALYDLGRGEANQAEWQENMATVIHEATHQSAFNTGIHSRLSKSPLWVIEGLGTMFEAPGVWNNAKNRGRDERLNRGRLIDFKNYVAGGRPREGALEDFIASDKLFGQNMSVAYAEAWALTYWLVETRPDDYRRYLRKIAARPDFSDCTAPQRLADFTSAFGRDLAMLDMQFVRYFDKLP
jgi:hypothetical protein